MTTRRAILVAALIGGIAVAQMVRPRPLQRGQLAEPLISDIEGLASELAARVKKAIGFLPNRAMKTDANGDLTAVIGEDDECVKVDGSAGACGGETDLTGYIEQGTGYTNSRAAVIGSDGKITAATGTLTNCVLVNGTSAVCGSGGAATFQELTDLKPSATSTVLTVQAGRCWGAAKAQATATITAGSGNGSFTVYCTDSQAIIVEYASSASVSVTTSNCDKLEHLSPHLPEGMFPIASGNITNGQWANLVDLRDFTRLTRHTNGAGMNVQCSGAVCVHAVDGAVVQTKDGNYTPLAQFDASGATMSRPTRSGTSLPGTCAVGEQFFKTDASAGSNLYGCTATDTWTAQAGGGSGVSITNNLWVPFGFGGADSTHQPGANVQRVYMVTPEVARSFSKIRYRTSGTGYVAVALVSLDGSTILTNSAARCNNNSVGSTNGISCNLGGTVTPTAGTSVYLVMTADASTGWYVEGGQFGVIGYGVGGQAPYIGTAANASTGSGATLAVSVPLGTISAHTATIAGNQPPAVIFAP